MLAKGCYVHSVCFVVTNAVLDHFTLVYQPLGCEQKGAGVLFTASIPQQQRQRNGNDSQPAPAPFPPPHLPDFRSAAPPPVKQKKIFLCSPSRQHNQSNDNLQPIGLPLQPIGLPLQQDPCASNAARRSTAPSRIHAPCAAEHRRALASLARSRRRSFRHSAAPLLHRVAAPSPLRVPAVPVARPLRCRSAAPSLHHVAAPSPLRVPAASVARPLCRTQAAYSRRVHRRADVTGEGPRDHFLPLVAFRANKAPNHGNAAQTRMPVMHACLPSQHCRSPALLRKPVCPQNVREQIFTAMQVRCDCPVLPGRACLGIVVL